MTHSMPTTSPRLMLVALAIAVASSACGASKGGPAAEPAKARASGGGMGSGPHSLEQHRAEFQAACQRTPDLQAFCDCGWAVFSSEFTAAEIESEEIPAERLEAVQNKAESTCVSKMPESAVRRSFVKACSHETQSYEPYCQCFWPELRARFSVQQIADPAMADSAGFASARTEIARKCSPKLPEDSVREAFMSGCNEEHPGIERFCECAWTQVRTELSLGEIESITSPNAPEMRRAQQRIHTGCDGLLARDTESR